MLLLSRRAEAKRVKRWQRSEEQAFRERERLAGVLLEMGRGAVIAHRFAAAMTANYVQTGWLGGTVPRRREVL